MRSQEDWEDNVSRYFNQAIHPYYDVKIVGRLKSFRLSQAGLAVFQHIKANPPSWGVEQRLCESMIVHNWVFLSGLRGLKLPLNEAVKLQRTSFLPLRFCGQKWILYG